MWLLIALCALIAVLSGLVVRFVLRLRHVPEAQNINTVEMILGGAVCALLVVPATVGIGWSIGKNAAATYREYYSAMEASYNEQVTTCTRDGACVHEYQCDPYTVTYLATETYTKADGTTGTRTVTRTRTEYHSCPYTTTEHTFTVTNDAGTTYTLAANWFPENPHKHLWRPSDFSGLFSEELPAGVGAGVPAAWTRAKDRIDAGNPSGTTERHDYKNLILASQDDIYTKHSDDIDDYVAAGLMPKVTTTIYDAYLADKAYFVGNVPAGTTAGAWQEEVMRLNGVVGPQKQADLHLVLLTDTDTGSDIDRYTTALNAYWQSDALGKDTLSKNGIVIVVAIDDTTVTDARAFTGMPAGNEAFTQDIADRLDGLTATPESLLGTDGAIRAAIFDAETGFERVPMEGYAYLFDSIQPSTGAKVATGVAAVVISALVWVAMLALDLRVPATWSAAVNAERLRRRPTTVT